MQASKTPMTTKDARLFAAWVKDTAVERGLTLRDLVTVLGHIVDMLTDDVRTSTPAK